MTELHAIAVVDLEATCSNTNAGDHTIPDDEMETIEIGAVVLRHHDFAILDDFCAFVRPVVHPQLTDFCQQLTGISQAEVDAAGGFDRVFPRFRQWLADHGVGAWASWGNYDAYQLRRDAERHQLIDEVAALPPHHNFKKWWARQMGVKRCGMGRAVAIAGLTWQGRQHRGIDDARMLAQLVPVAGWASELDGVTLSHG